MSEPAQYFVYILTNKTNRVIYTGVTNNLERRLFEHRSNQVPGFTAKYRCHKLVYFEDTPSVEAAITREKQIKGWLRKKKIALVNSVNPNWDDLGRF
ncbi:GIY-YIG nuclease family protein [Porticoccus sp. W117]|uniref:GIY-YIG nuclease family protein n=1 Tax=Porticoccus sp. W117 TaxID=3054777 RepID=UPI00259530AA|nr:GIY-YIG nuclease family protein [Porticoccus sp. W117]MDM3870179.1 GIY-YIG nuclease family protein [Porticoccus sp. W117]